MGGKSKYRRKSNPMNNWGSLVATLVILYFLFCCVVLPLIDWLGGFWEILADIVEVIPFGEAWYWVALQIVSALTGQTAQNIAISGGLTFQYMISELAQGLFTVILYEASTTFLFGIMGLNDKGRWIKSKKLAVKMGMAVICACFAPGLINFIFSNLSNMSIGWQIFIPTLVSIILTGGGFVFFMLLLGLTVGQALIYVILKFILLGTVRLIGTYVFMMICLIGIQTHAFGMLAGGAAGFIVIVILMVGIELMADSLFT